MDGIALEIWNKKLILCRYRRQTAFKNCLDGSRIKGHFFNPVLIADLFQAASDNLDLLMLYWKESFLSSWQREKPADPALAAEKAQTDVIVFLAGEQKQIEGEIITLTNEQGLNLKPEDLKEGKGLMEREASGLRGSCLTLIADLKTVREDDLRREELQETSRHREMLQTRMLLGILVISGTLGGVWLGYTTRAKYSTQDRDYIDKKLNILAEGHHQIYEALNDIHRSNRKIAFWTERTSPQIDQEIEDSKSNFKKQVMDIREETARKIANLESEYARSGRDGDDELERQKQNLITLRDEQIKEVEERTRAHLQNLEEQRSNLQH